MEIFQQAKNNIIVFPNPTDGILNFSSNIDSDHVDIYNTSGTLVMHSKAASQLDMETLPAGLYFVKIQTSTGHELHRVIKD